MALTPERMAAACDDRAALARLLAVEVPPSWPNPDSAVLLPLLAEALRDEPERAAWRRLVIERETRRLIGDLGATDPPTPLGVFELGYGIIPEARGRGFATEAARGFVDWAARQPGVRVALAETRADHVTSQAVLRRVGFEQAGRGVDPVEGPTVRWRLRL